MSLAKKLLEEGAIGELFMIESEYAHDYMKLCDVSKNVISALTASEVVDAVVAWAKEYDPEFASTLEEDRAYQDNHGDSDAEEGMQKAHIATRIIGRYSRDNGAYKHLGKSRRDREYHSCDCQSRED